MLVCMWTHQVDLYPSILNIYWYPLESIWNPNVQAGLVKNSVNIYNWIQSTKYCPKDSQKKGQLQQWPVTHITKGRVNMQIICLCTFHSFKKKTGEMTVIKARLLLCGHFCLSYVIIQLFVLNIAPIYVLHKQWTYSRIIEQWCQF